MFDFYLPLEEYFVKILLENKIQNWEAKKFWLNISQSHPDIDNNLRKQMYNSLRVLTSNDLLTVEYSKYNLKNFIYSETIKLYKFREIFLSSNYKLILENENEIIKNELEQYDFQIKFIDELYSKYPELNPQYLEIKRNIDLNRKICKAKFTTIIELDNLIKK